MMTEDEAMQRALAEARAAEHAGEVPVGAVIVRQGRILATGQNRVIRDSDPTAHAEMVALRAAGHALGNYRLGQCTLYTTLEPCAMCAGAILHARLDRLVYAAADPKAGACGSVLTVLNHPALNHRIFLESGLLAEECGALLTTFFRSRRTLHQKVNGLPSRGIQCDDKTRSKELPPMAPKKWSGKVDTDTTHPDHGLFLEDAESIAKALATPKVSPKGPVSGMRMLTFYMNRAGKNLPEDRVKELERAKEILSSIIASKKPAKATAKKATAAKKAPAKKALKKDTSGNKNA